MLRVQILLINLLTLTWKDFIGFVISLLIGLKKNKSYAWKLTKHMRQKEKEVNIYAYVDIIWASSSYAEILFGKESLRWNFLSTRSQNNLIFVGEMFTLLKTTMSRKYSKLVNQCIIKTKSISLLDLSKKILILVIMMSKNILFCS